MWSPFVSAIPDCTRRVDESHSRNEAKPQLWRHFSSLTLFSVLRAVFSRSTFCLLVSILSALVRAIKQPLKTLSKSQSPDDQRFPPHNLPVSLSPLSGTLQRLVTCLGYHAGKRIPSHTEAEILVYCAPYIGLFKQKRSR